MGVKIEVRKGESIEEALKRFKRILKRAKAPSVQRPRWYKKQRLYYLKPSHRRRRRWLVDQAVKRYVPVDAMGQIPKHMSKRKSWPKSWVIR